jgi:predicted  nucleic acid-binding Zn-ribbon protein
MTPAKYYIALIAKSFGIERRAKRLADASSEMSLLRQAEYQLGATLWDRTEGVDALSVEYWNLRKYIKEHDEHLKLMTELNEKLANLHEERANILNESSPNQDGIEQQRTELLSHLEELAQERDLLVRRAREIRRIHEGHLTKIEVLKRDAFPPSEIEKVKQEIANLKQEFRELKNQREKIAAELEAGDHKLDSIDTQLQEFKQSKRERAAVVFQEMGIINRQLSELRSLIGNCDAQIRQLQADVGRYISRYHKRNPQCANIARDQRTMVEVMRLLRISISMNHKLADMK